MKDNIRKNKKYFTFNPYSDNININLINQLILIKRGRGTGPMTPRQPSDFIGLKRC